MPLLPSVQQELRRPPQPVLERDRRDEAERLARLAHVGPRVPKISGARRQVAALDRLVEQASDRVRELVDRRGRTRGDVEYPPAHVLCVPGDQVRRDDVVDVREVTRLLPVVEDRHRLAGGDRRDEERDDRRVLRAGILARSEDVEVAQDDRLERVVHAREADAVALGGELRDPVRRDRIRRHRLAQRQLRPVPVDRRGRREDDPADALVARGEQHVERALDVDRARRERILDRARNRSEGAEVEDELDASYRVMHALVAPELPLDELDVPVQPREVRAVASREVVEHAHVVAAGEQRAYEVRAEEARSPASASRPQTIATPAPAAQGRGACTTVLQPRTIPPAPTASRSTRPTRPASASIWM